MKHISAILLIAFLAFYYGSQDKSLNDAQQRIMDNRLSEAKAFWTNMQSSGFSENTVSVLDFVFISESESDANNLVKQLSDQYTLETNPIDNSTNIQVKGSNRPDGNKFTDKQWLAWVEDMVMTGFSHNAEFSNWLVSSSDTNTSWSSESVNN